MAISILMCEDHTMFREVISTFLSDENFEIVGHAEEGHKAVELAEELQPDVIVLDLTLPELNGIEAGRQILEAAPHSSLVALTMHGESDYVIDALRTGFRGYVLKSEARDDLVRAIKEVHRGAVYLSPEISNHVVQAYLRGEELSSDPLTPRETEVLQLVAVGNTTRETAEILGIAVKTAETHRANLMEKLDIHNTAGLVRYAVRKGLIKA